MTHYAVDGIPRNDAAQAAFFRRLSELTEHLCVGVGRVCGAFRADLVNVPGCATNGFETAAGIGAPNWVGSRAARSGRLGRRLAGLPPAERSRGILDGVLMSLDGTCCEGFSSGMVRGSTMPVVHDLLPLSSVAELPRNEDNHLRVFDTALAWYRVVHK